jgi:hypothetical protein
MIAVSEADAVKEAAAVSLLPTHQNSEIARQKRFIALSDKTNYLCYPSSLSESYPILPLSGVTRPRPQLRRYFLQPICFFDS